MTQARPNGAEDLRAVSIGLRTVRALGGLASDIGKLAVAVAAVAAGAWALLSPHAERWADARSQAVVAAHVDADHTEVQTRLAAAAKAAHDADVTAQEAIAAVHRQTPALGSLLCASARGHPLQRSCDLGSTRIPYGSLEALVDEADARRRP